MIGIGSLSETGGAVAASIPSPPESSFDIGPLTLNAYGLAIATGVLVALWLARNRYSAAGGDPEFMDRVAIWAIVAGIIGARIGFVIPRVDRFSDDPVEAFEIWGGGLTFFGALFGGFLVGGLLLHRNNVSIALFLTAVAPAIPLAQAIGRWGNYFNQELYGDPTDLPWALEIDPEHRVSGYEQFETFHPTFLYEVLWNLALVAVMLFVIERRVKLRPGSLFGVYLIGYGIGRFLMELIRIDTEWRFLGLSRNAYNSLLIALVGAVGLWWWERRAPRPDDESDSSDASDDEPAADDESDKADADDMNDDKADADATEADDDIADDEEATVEAD
jgi:prolipoprotein diacylglyceryl transferase